MLPEKVLIDRLKLCKSINHSFKTFSLAKSINDANDTFKNY